MKWENKEEIIKETIWTCGSWRLMLENDKFFITNTKLLLSPCGNGTTEKETMVNMLSNIAKYRKKLEKVEAEIKEHLATLGGENE